MAREQLGEIINLTLPGGTVVQAHENSALHYAYARMGATPAPAGVVPDAWPGAIDDVDLDAKTAALVTAGTGALPAALRAASVAAVAGIDVIPAAIPAAGFTPANTARFRAKLAAVRADTADLKMLCIGDSTTHGIGSTATEYQAQSYPAQLADLLDGTFAPTAPGLAIAPLGSGALGAASDSRWGLGAGWTASNTNLTGWGQGLAFRVDAPSTAGNLTFTPGVACDTWTIYYTTNASATYAMTFAASVDGGAATTVVTKSTDGIGSLTVTSPVSNTSTLTIHPTAGGNFAYILGVETRLSTRRQLLVGNAGASSSTASDWANDGGPTRSLASIRAYAPDLSIIMLGINDAGAGTTAATYKAKLTAIVAACQLSGDAILMSVIPSSPFNAARLTLEGEYRTTAREVARSKGCAFIDVLGRWGSYEETEAAGWMYDAVHANATGYADIASAVRDALYLI